MDLRLQVARVELRLQAVETAAAGKGAVLVYRRSPARDPLERTATTLPRVVECKTMGKKGKNTAKKKAAQQEAKAAEKSNRGLKRDLPAKIDAVLAKGQEETKDIDLFADPPPQEECAICLHPHSLESVGG